MSMTISAAHYLNSTYQNTRTTDTEKPGQKDSKAEIGKTQQSDISASLDQVNMGKEGIAVAEVSRQQGADQSTAQKQPAAPRMDRVEISQVQLLAVAFDGLLRKKGLLKSRSYNNLLNL